jgi:predicted NAD/FAD-binding protein
MSYDHPIHDLVAVRAQPRLAEIASDTTVFAGAYHGWGFHEDGARSGVAAAAHFGVEW